MKYIYLVLVFFLAGLDSFASYMDTTIIVPLQRRNFHDKIDTEQRLCDKADGKQDNFFRISGNEAINSHVTHVLFRKVDNLENWIELNKDIDNNNQKIRYLRYIENTLAKESFRLAAQKLGLRCRMVRRDLHA